jgi:hypothetical protein
MTDKEKALKNLGLTDEEIADVVDTDRRIDKGEKLFELPKELEKGAKKARMSGNTKGYTKANREKKVDTEKRAIIQCMTEIAENLADNGIVNLTNAEREFDFVYKDRKFKVVLSCPRN